MSPVQSVTHVSGLYRLLPNPRMQPTGRMSAKPRAGGTLLGRAEERTSVRA
jgi:hypothetical protein